MKHDYTLSKQVGPFEVKISPSTNYGFFEHDTLGEDCGGGLWFEGGALIDYDGVYCLPVKVIEAVELLGFNADYAL